MIYRYNKAKISYLRNDVMKRMTLSIVGFLVLLSSFNVLAGEPIVDITPINPVPSQRDIQRLFDEEVANANKNMVKNSNYLGGNVQEDMFAHQLMSSMQIKAKVDKATCEATDKPNTYDCLIYTTSKMMDYETTNKSVITVKRIAGELVFVK